MHIRHSQPDDLPVLLSIFEEAKQKMRAANNLNQWTNGYPSPQLLLDDIQKQQSYIILKDSIPLATFVLASGNDPTYTSIYQGAWLNDSQPYLTIHRLASRHEAHGIAQLVFNYAYSILPNLRADTHRDNLPMRHILTTNGFQYCGIIHLLNGDERLAYQKI